MMSPPSICGERSIMDGTPREPNPGHALPITETAEHHHQCERWAPTITISLHSASPGLPVLLSDNSRSPLTLISEAMPSLPELQSQPVTPRADNLDSPFVLDSHADVTEEADHTKLLHHPEALIASGQDVMHERLATVIDDTLGMPIPTMDVRFQDITVRARFSVYPSSTFSKLHVPTLLSPFKRGAQRLLLRHEVVEKKILKGVSGVFRPGTVTLMLGGPGSGKSSLMKILSGRFALNSDVSLEGKILYNGMPREEVLHRITRFVGYTDATDHHHGRLSVAETLQFAHTCSSGTELPSWVHEAVAHVSPEERKRALDLIGAHHRHAPALMAKKLGLDGVRDVLVGDAAVPGVSPTDKRRVTIGEMAFGPKAVHIIDEINSGLSASATRQIVESLRSVALNFNRTVVVSLSQPSHDVLDLFDDIMLMADGHVIFHGPRDQAVPHFESLGMKLPRRTSISDFLLDIGTVRQAMYETRPNVSSSAAELASYFEQSSIHEATLQYLQAPNQSTQSSYVPPADHLVPFRQSYLEDLVLLFRRQLRLTVRNKPMLIGRNVMVTIMAVLYGTSFWNMQDSNAQTVVGLLFSSILFLSMGQAAQTSIFLNTRNVFYKHRSANLFRTSAYVLAACISQIPFAVLESILYGVIVYWMAGYVALADRFLTFLLTMVLCQMSFTALFFFLATASPTNAIAQSVMVISILLFALFSGFLVVKSSLPSYLSWLYWLNPIAWTIMALAVNQFTSPKYQVCTYEGLDYCDKYRVKSMADYSLGLFDMNNDVNWVYYAWLALTATYVVLCLLAWLVLEYKRYETPEDTAAIALDLKVVRKKAKQELSEHSTSLEDSVSYVLQAKTPTSAAIHLGESLEASAFTITIPHDGGGASADLMTVAFEHLSTDTLKNVTGFAVPGTLTAVLGDGKPKSDLLQVLAGRLAVPQQGAVYLNGSQVSGEVLRRSTCLCVAHSPHADSATFREALQFSAELRQGGNVSKAAKLALVEEILELLELRGIANRVIRGSRPDQLKRLSIGVELAAAPKVLLVDDPTAAMDPHTSSVIMKTLRHIAMKGCAVICTMSQPRTTTFNLVDRALVLQQDGRTSFFGEIGQDATKLIEYFEQIPSVPRLPPGSSPAMWVLSCVRTITSTDFPNLFAASQTGQMLAGIMGHGGITQPTPMLLKPDLGSRHAACTPLQIAELTKRYFRMHWRTPTYNLTRLLLNLVMSGLFAILYNKIEFDTFRGANSGVGMVYLSSILIGYVAFNNAMPLAITERAIFRHERQQNSYNVFSYAVATTVAELPFVLLSGLLFTCIVFPALGFEGTDNFIYYWLVVALHTIVEVYLAQFVVYGLPSPQAAPAIGGFIVSLYFLFVGFNPATYKLLDVYKWIYYATPPSYTIAAIASRVYAPCSAPGGPELGCQPLKNAPVRFAGSTVASYLDAAYNIRFESFDHYVLVLGLIAVGLRIAGTFMLYRHNQS